MNFKRNISVILMISFLLAGCQIGQNNAGTKSPEATTLPTIIVVTNTPAPATETAIPLATATPETAATAAPVTLPDYSSAAYIDDRSTPAGLVVSFVNALNRHEYLRAYSYWSDPATALGTLDAFGAAYDGTSAVTVALGSVSSDGAAGSIYFTLPAVLTQTLTAGGTAKTTECYVLRLPQPGNYGEPPITPMHFYQTIAHAVDAATSDADALASTCSGSDMTGMSGEAASFAPVNDISSANYLDNRSGAVEVVSSLLNALNRKEYVRAYSYWQDTAAVGSYDSYAAGFSDTDSITAVFGAVSSDAGAGQLHYQVPLGMIVTTTAHTTQTFIGCYTLHLANPGMQGTLPFEPLGITQGHFTLVANGMDLNPLLATACH